MRSDQCDLTANHIGKITSMRTASGNVKFEKMLNWQSQFRKILPCMSHALGSNQIDMNMITRSGVKHRYVHRNQPGFLAASDSIALAWIASLARKSCNHHRHRHQHDNVVGVHGDHSADCNTRDLTPTSVRVLR